MNNRMNIKIVEVLEKGGYSKDFIKGIMKKNEWLPKNFAFRKDALDLLLARYKKKITDFIHDTYPEKDWKNKSVQIHKLLNPKKNQPKYYTDTDLANDLSHWVNTFTDKEDTLISANFFAVKSINEGSFFLPLLGTGAKYGLSVSIKILSNGKDLNVSCSPKEFLKVIIPLAEKKAFKDKSFFAKSLLPVKQCIKIFRF